MYKILPAQIIEWEEFPCIEFPKLPTKPSFFNINYVKIILTNNTILCISSIIYVFKR